MPWTVEFEPRAEAELRRLDPVVIRRILAFLKQRVAEHPSPRALAEPLKGEIKSLCRWRVGDYRIIGRVEDERLTILIVAVGHRREIYR